MSRPVTRSQTRSVVEGIVNPQPVACVSRSAQPLLRRPGSRLAVPALPLQSAVPTTATATGGPQPVSCASRGSPTSMLAAISLTSPPTSPLRSSHSPTTTRALPVQRRSTLQGMSKHIQLLLAFEKGVCSFCSVELKEMEGIMLDTCLHIFCRECLKGTIEQQEAVQIRCPISEESGCNGYLLDKEIQALVSPQDFKNYMGRSMILARQEMTNVFQCRSTGCVGFCEFEDGSKIFPCYICGKTNCLECQAIHEGIDCSVYQNVLKVAKSSGKEANDLIEKEKNLNGWEQLRDIIGNEDGQGNLGNVLLGLQDRDLFKTTRIFDCPICLTEIPVGEGVILQDCLHVFCCDCLIGNIEHSDDPNVKCPHMGANYSCVNCLKPREIKALVPAEIYERHLLRSVKLAENAMANSYHCKTPDCTGWCELDRAGGNEFEVFKCHICGKNNCLKCQVIHEGVTCEDYKNRLVQNENDQLSEAAVNDMVSKGECMRCPRCKTVVQKIIGCDWMICSACRSELCWATKGLRWGPLGKGDITGGCKCAYTTGHQRHKCQRHLITDMGAWQYSRPEIKIVLPPQTHCPFVRNVSCIEVDIINFYGFLLKISSLRDIDWIGK